MPTQVTPTPVKTDAQLVSDLQANVSSVIGSQTSPIYAQGDPVNVIDSAAATAASLLRPVGAVLFWNPSDRIAYVRCYHTNGYEMTVPFTTAQLQKRT